MTSTLDKQSAATTPDQLLQQLQWRYATKKFDPSRKIPEAVWATLEQALILSPSSFGLQPWKFLVITDPSLRQRLRPVSWNQPQITDASHLVVLTHRKDLEVSDVEHYIQRIAEVRQVSEDSLKDYKKMMLDFTSRTGQGFDINAWTARQVYIALGVFLSSAALLGIDACPMEGFDPLQYDRILGLDGQRFHTLCVAAAGYRAKDDAFAHMAKVRFPHGEVISRR